MSQENDFPIFDQPKLEEGIKAVVEAMGKVGLNMLEAWWVAYHVAIGAKGQLDDDFADKVAQIEAEDAEKGVHPGP